LKALPIETLLQRRQERLLGVGVFNRE